MEVGAEEMAAITKSRMTPRYKTKYRVMNWAAYEKSLRQRGDISIWFDEAAVQAWNAPPCGLPGGQLKYSDVAIVTALTQRTVFHLPLRQTEGFLASLIRRMGVIPPKSTAVVGARAEGAWRQWNAALERIAGVGGGQWRKESVAHYQARAENGMYRYKRVIGDRLRARTGGSQATEPMIAVNVLNRMTELGNPESVAIGV